jgi:AraC-like DNA-binding protein
MGMRRKASEPTDNAVIREVLKWSPHCHEHFLPWRSAIAQPLQQNNIGEAGISDLFPGYELGRTDPRFHLLVFTVLGEGVLRTAEGETPIVKDSLLVVPAHVPFGYQPNGGRWRFLWFHLRDQGKWQRLGAGKAHLRRTFFGESLLAVTEGLLRESRRHTPASREAAELYAALICNYIDREIGAHVAEPGHTVRQELQELWEIVALDLKRAWSVAQLAARMGISESHLHRVCHEQLSSSPMKLVARLRMERAQELLIIYDHPVRVIAEMVGYQNEYAFFTAFRRFAGVTPGQFRLRR